MTATLLDLVDLRACSGDFDRALPAPVAAPGPVEAVRDIIAAVRSTGDAALRDLTARFDGVTVDELRVPATALAAAWRDAPAELQPRSSTPPTRSAPTTRPRLRRR